MNTSQDLPHSVEIEAGLLSCCLIDGADTLSACINQGISAQTFYAPENQVIFDCLVSMLSESLPIDLTVLIQQLRLSDRLDEAGGVDNLYQVGKQAPTTAQASYFAAKLIELYERREIIRAAARLTETCRAQSGEELNEAVSKSVAHLLALSSGSQATPEPIWADVVDEAGNVLNAIIENKGMPAHLVIPFPWESMDEYFSPMQRGQLVVLGARPSVGKSSLARQVALHAAKCRHKVYFITLEVNPVKVALQMAASLSGIGIRQVATAHAKDQSDLKAALKGLRSFGLTISTRDRTIARLVGRARALHAKGMLDMLVLDHGLLIDDIAASPQSERAVLIGSLTKALKKLATELNIVCLLLWQLNRASARDGNREPTLTDLKDSGSLEEDADKVLFIHRPAEDGYCGQEQEEHSSLEDRPSFFQNIIQAKGRDDGTSIVSFYFDRQIATFRPATRQQQPTLVR